MRRCRMSTYALVLLVFASAQMGMAAGLPGAPLPWETVLLSIMNSMAGPVARAIGVIGFAVAGGTTVFGGELNELGRRAVMLGLSVGLLVFSMSALSTLFTTIAVGGATVL